MLVSFQYVCFCFSIPHVPPKSNGYVDVDLFALCCTQYNKVLFYPFHEVTNAEGNSKTAIYIKDNIIRSNDNEASLEAALKSITEHNNQLQYNYG